MTIVDAFGDVADVLAKMNPDMVAALKAPTAMGERVAGLIQKKKNGNLSEEENRELERFLALDMLINLAKARAKILLAT